MTKDKKVATLSIFPMEFTVQFEYKVTEIEFKGLTNIIHITTGGDDREYGNRMATVFVNNKKKIITMMISSAVSGIKNYALGPTEIAIYKWIMVRVSQVKVGDDYVYRVELDGVELTKVTNKKPMEFQNVTVYVSDPWRTPASGSIRKLTIKGIFLLNIFCNF